MTNTIELTLTHIAAGGDAVGFTTAGEAPIFTPGGIPGERVRVELELERPRWRRGRIVEILEPSPDRIAPPCPYFQQPQAGRDLPHCTGCHWQHISYERQLDLKRRIVIDQVAKHGRLGDSPEKSQAQAASLVEDVIALGDPDAPEDAAVLEYGYCTEMRFALDQVGRLCLPGSQGKPIPIDGCLLQHPQLAELFAAWEVDPETGSHLAAELRSVTMAVGGVGGGSLSTQGHSETAVGALILESVRGETPELSLQLPVNVFLYQPAKETQQLELLVGDWTWPMAVGGRTYLTYPSAGERRLVWPHVLANEALAVIGVEMLGLQTFEHAVELWAGIGTGSVVLAEEAATVIVLDDHPLAAAALEANLAGMDNVSPRPGPVDEMLDELVREGHRCNAALMTPPNMTVAVDAFKRLPDLGVNRVVLLTDDVADLARSLPTIQADGYVARVIQPVDIYPQRPEVAVAIRFERV